jgi:membrane-bound lytic murein transglycosylase D
MSKLFFYIILIQGLFLQGSVVALCADTIHLGDSVNWSKVDAIDEKIANENKGSLINKATSEKPLDVFPDIYFEYRIELLNNVSPIKLDYNSDVRKYIDLFTKDRKEGIAKTLGLTKLYFPVFEEYLDKYNLPQELKYLPIIESGLNASAKSSSGAMGLWQLLLNSSKLLGLEVDSYVDERCELYKSTDAACRYLKYLYSVFNDWQLALAAYNGGPGEVRNAIIRSGGKTDFWEIQPWLPEQTKWYVPAFIAAVYIANHYPEHAIIPLKPEFDFSEIDTLNITEAAEFSRISEKLNLPIETIRQLNPSYRLDYIPATEKAQTLVLPSDKITAFLKVENQIYSKKKYIPNYIDITNNAGDTKGLEKRVYTVEQGDFLHKIALSFGCTTENLRAWNKLEKDNLSKGQKLIVWIKPTSETSKNDSTLVPPVNPQIIYYTVKEGDTIWSIAERFHCDSVAELKAMNNISNERNIQPGQTLKIIKK